jgi:hypothetical protein
MANELPPFRDDGYLPDGLHKTNLATVVETFGKNSRRRQFLVFRLQRWIELARNVRAQKLFIDGSFVTEKNEPNDIDAVVLLPSDFRDQVLSGLESAIELEYMLLTRRPEEIFAAEDDNDWDEWIQFFMQTREFDNRTKGLVEIEL